MKFNTWKFSSTGPGDTECLGNIIGLKMRGGEVVDLIGDLGGGKTTFVRGLVRGVGSDTRVSSPTFKICNTYDVSVELTRRPSRVYHFDFYRLSEAGIVLDELAEVLEENSAVVVAEWSSTIQSILPEERLSIRFVSSGELTRLIEFTWPKRLDYLMKEMIS